MAAAPQTPRPAAPAWSLSLPYWASANPRPAPGRRLGSLHARLRRRAQRPVPAERPDAPKAA